jgi:acetyl esterase/lipase
MTRGALVTTVTLVLLMGSSAADLRVSLRSVAAAYLNDIASIAPIAGRETTFDYYERLRDDEQTLDDPEIPTGYTSAQWSQTVSNFATLDLSLATQLLAKRYASIASIRGLGEALVRSSKDGTMQPVAVYVPRGYEPGKPAPLIVFLHGRPQPESQLLAPPFVAQLADTTGAIVVAPWGRGYYDFRQSSQDVYDAARAARDAFTIDPRKVFLAGYSMGGFAVYEVAALHPDVWSAVMSIAGALLGSDAEHVVSAMPRTPFYVLTGAADDSIPTQYPMATAGFLRSAGIEVSFYSLQGGTHRLITLLPILAQAWNDMLHGVIRAPPESFGMMKLPGAVPTMSLRP